MAEPDLPAAQGRPYRIALVCLGNICRSPMADIVLSTKLADAGLGESVEVTSCGTGDWHVGEPIDPRAADVLDAAGYDSRAHRARHFKVDWLDRDLILTMDRSNLSDVLAQGGNPKQVRLFRSFDPVAKPGDDEVPDPWYGGPDGFADVLDMIERTSTHLVNRLRSHLV